MKNLAFPLLLTFFLFISPVIENASAQSYCIANHYYGCTYTANGNTYRQYAAINKLNFNQNGSTLFSKTPDGCNQAPARNSGSGHYNVMSKTPSFTLTAGGTYEVEFNITNPGGYNGYSNYFMVYIDLNGDFDFTDPGEHISAGWPQFSSVTTHKRSFSIPCKGIVSQNTVLRVRSDYRYGRLRNTNGNSCGQGWQGETEDFTIALDQPNNVTAQFSAPATAYVKTNVRLVDQSNGFLTEWDIDNDGSYDGTGVYFDNIWTTSGKKEIKIRTTNCFGVDSIVKSISIVRPSQVPRIDLIANKTITESNATIKFFDLSDYGPWEWQWQIKDTLNKVIFTEADATGGSGIFPKQNPWFYFDNPGKYTVIMRARNDVGWSQWAGKKNYIKILPVSAFNVGASIKKSDFTSGSIFDNGGPDNNHERYANENKNNFLIIPCNAKKITLTMSQFNMSDNRDKLYIFDGKNKNGTPLHPSGGFSIDNVPSSPFSVEATSGAMYIYYETDGSGTDSGFAATWKTELTDPIFPVPKWETTYSTIYKGANTNFFNASDSVEGLLFYKWTIGQSIYYQENISHTFSEDGTFNVCLQVTTCNGSRTYCKNVTVITPKSPTILDFSAKNARPNVGESVKFDVQSDKASSFEWTVYPNNISYDVGYDKSSREPRIRFNKSGCYNVTLKAWNSINPSATSKTVVKDYYICVIDYCEPLITLGSVDVGINKVILNDGSRDIIYNESTSGIQGYTDFSKDHSAKVDFGATYTVTMSRNTHSDPWNGKIWIDWNVDGDFDDAGEEILSEPSSYSSYFSVTFKVPDYKTAFEGTAKMRVASGYKNNSNLACGPSIVGEYEDYGLEITNDGDIPLISLIPTKSGETDTIRIQKSVLGSWVDPGVLAIDPSQGDISANIVSNTDLEEDVPGIYTKEYNVCDASGNCAEEMTRVIIVVLDHTPPQLTLNGASPMNIDVIDKRGCGSTMNTVGYTELGANAFDVESNRDFTSSISISGNVDDTKIGTYIITYSVADIQRNSASIDRVVNVVDLVDPVIKENGATQIQIGTVWVDQTVVCDNYYDNVTLERIPGFNGIPTPHKRGDYPVTYNATDGSGNNAITVVRAYRVDDFIPPTIDLHTTDTIYHDVNTPYFTTPATTKDNYYSSTSVSLVKIGTVDFSKIGTYIETYTAKDESGNKSVKNRYVKVIDRKAPEISAEIIRVNVGQPFNPMFGINIRDNYFSPGQLLPLVEIVSSNVNIWEPGYYSIVYELTDPSGNTSQRLSRIVQVGYDINSNVSVDEINLEEAVKIYPVPTNGKISIEVIIPPNIPIEAKVLNILGEEIIDLGIIQNGTTSVNLKGQKAGVYMIELSSGRKTVIKKLLLI
jgi:hypothetical protein